MLAATPANLTTPPGGMVAEHTRATVIGQPVAWALRGPRRCTGIWASTGRRPCPAQAALADSTDPQCAGCAAADRGRALARDALPGGDGRTYHLYLAWFGPGLVKVGLTAADRDRDRLLEQGAITCTLLAAGPYPPIRHAEHRISTARLAAERLAARAKATAWWQLPPAPERARQMRSARQYVTAQMTWPSGLEFLADTVTDQAGDFGLDEPVPESYQEVISLGSEPELAGTIRFIVGRRVLLDTASGPLLADMRRFAGWTITASAARAADGLGTVTRTQLEDRHDRRDTLF